MTTTSLLLQQFHLFIAKRKKTAILLLIGSSFFACRTTTTQTPVVIVKSPLEQYAVAKDTVFKHTHISEIAGEGFTTHLIRMNSQRWLTTAEVTDPLWWHWITIVVPEKLKGNKALLFIGGGSRNTAQPSKANELMVQAALATGSVVAELHNVPNQPMQFIGDDYGPRVEDELIAYGWRQYLEGGAKEADTKWLARLPMTRSAVRAMDALTAFSEERMEKKISAFVVAGGSKRGWTTWTTAIVDDRVVAIVPIVIDMLNAVPSFQHHWRAYGKWAPAVGNYDEEGIMEWQNSKEYSKLLNHTEPYSYLSKLDLPKLLINATGDQFFLPDSWQFYWDDLKGEKHIRYVPNGDHSLSGTDAFESLIAFHNQIVNDIPRPDFDWRVEGSEIIIKTNSNHIPDAINLWQAHDSTARDFRVETIGKAWTSQPISLTKNGEYRLSVELPEEGYTAFFGECVFSDSGPVPLKLTTGVVVVPNTYPHPPFVSSSPKGTQDE